ncbi:hypothetical protein F0Q45_04270 [Mycobacterium simiae]|uniref:Ferric siderophore reductase C-terminal domain-containing protein n=2 Tax=Mycobacterium simiae TaxID=1784 RepID=A0A5B1BVI6_MYCSI|nr:hypothetical protein F0Q45_04270 [Mycobacterium simiae]
MVPDLSELQRADDAAQLRLPEPVGERVSPSPERVLTGLGFRRRSCCLCYRAPAGSKCGDCPL